MAAGQKFDGMDWTVEHERPKKAASPAFCFSLRHQRGDVSKHHSDLLNWIDLASPAKDHPFDQIHPPLSLLDACDVVLFSPYSRGQIALRHVPLLAQVHYSSGKRVGGSGKHGRRHRLPMVGAEFV